MVNFGANRHRPGIRRIASGPLSPLPCRPGHRRYPMANHTTESNWINRLLAAVIDTSATAVAVHYAAPWNRPQGKRASEDIRAA